MKISVEAKRRWQVALGFGVFMALSLAANYFLGLLPSFEEKCQAQCRAIGKSGHMEHIYPEAMTRGVRGRGPEQCKCS